MRKMEWCSSCNETVSDRIETQDRGKYYAVDHLCAKCGKFLFSLHVYKTEASEVKF